MMKKVFIFRQNIINGTVTMKTVTTAFGTRELAEKVMQAAKDENADRDIYGLRVCYSPIEEISVLETEEEVPILNKHD